MVTWSAHPDILLESDSNDISAEGIRVAVHRPENAVSYCELVATDTDGEHYIANIDAHSVIEVSFRYDADAFEKVFEGTVEKVGPLLSRQGQNVAAVAYGYGAALRRTHNNAQYGLQISAALDTPTNVWDDLIDNYVNKAFNGAATGYALNKNRVGNMVTPLIPFLDSKYRKNIDILNLVCDLRSADRGAVGAAGPHWFVDTLGQVNIDQIGTHIVHADWPTWWRTDQAGSTLTEAVDFKSSNFIKRVSDFANKIIVVSDLRMPGRDYWTESAAGGTGIWGSIALSAFVDDGGAGNYVVGLDSVKMTSNGAVQGRAWYPNAEDAAWDITMAGSEETIPSLNFYFMKDVNVIEASTTVRLFTTDNNTDYYQALFNWWTDPDDEFIHRNLPIGPYWKTVQEDRLFRWTANGAPDWTDINGICFATVGAGGDAELWIDDLHIAGKIIREAYNSTSIAAVDEFQKVIHMTSAVDDSLTAADDSGTAGLIAYAELLRLQVVPVTGRVVIPGAPDALPGQLFYIESDQVTGVPGAGTYRIEDTFRAKEVLHTWGDRKFLTTLDLTDDLKNTHALGFADHVETLYKLMGTDPDAKNLRSSGVDVLIPRLSLDYP